MTIRMLPLLLALSLSACRQDPGSPTAEPVQPPVATAPGRPQSGLPTMKLWLGAHEIIAELATTSLQARTGMMFRTNMGTMEGMLFVFPWPEQRAFWMKNTPLPLDVAYIDPGGFIREIHPLHPLNENPVPSQTSDIQYVLEMNQGWFARHGVSVGMEIRTEKGSLGETFSRR